MPIVKLLKKVLIRLLMVFLIIILTLLTLRVYDSQQGKSLSLWHTAELHELTAQQIDNATWEDYLLAEEDLFNEVTQKITAQLSPSEHNIFNRYSANSRVNPHSFKTNWNRSFILQPEGQIQGAVVLLHGLTDSPYSLRHIALHYQQKGFVVIAIRMPGHGTAPSALTSVEWQDWFAATKLAVRTASSYINNEQPLHIVGYSNGGALGVMYSIEALSDSALRQADQLILISPMIGVTRFAQFAGLAALPAILPVFANSNWVDIIAEYNPFKYNSFPINGAKQSYQLTSALKNNRAKTEPALLTKLPPILTFISAVDNTINNQDTIDFYQSLTNHNNELVIFDVNRNSDIASLLNEQSHLAVTALLPPTPRGYKTTIITNNEQSQTIVETTDAEETSVTIKPLAIIYPSDIYSLSHIALPYPASDSLYGNTPSELNEFGISLGVLSIRGERKALVTSGDNLLRISYNPFYPFLLEQIDQTIDATLKQK